MRQDVEAVRLLGYHGQIFKHSDGDVVAEGRCLMAQLKAYGLDPRRVRHDATLLVVRYWGSELG